MFERNLLFNEIESLQINKEFEFEAQEKNVQAQSVFKQAGLKTTSVVNKETPALIQKALEQSDWLKPFIANKIARVSLSKNFFHYDFVEEFTGKYKKLNNIVVPFDSPEDKSFRNIRGFYHKKTDSIHLQPSANLGFALFLCIGKLSSPGFGGFFGYQVSDGVGHYFTNLVLREQGLEPLTIENKQERLDCGEDLVGAVEIGMVGKAYFQNHSDLIKHLMTKLSIGAVEIKEIRNDALCESKSQLLRTATFAAHRVENTVGVGITGANSVRLWLRSAAAGAHEAQITRSEGGVKSVKSVKFVIPAGKPGDKTFAFNYPNTPNAPNLDPLTKYEYGIIRTSDQKLVGKGSFETSPAGDADTPNKVAIGLISCHQPFRSRGDLHLHSTKMLRLLPRILKDNNVKFILPCGDQMYADNPEIFSLFENPYLIRQAFPGKTGKFRKTDIFDCSADEVRRIFDTRYRTFWSMDAIREMYANYPCYPILDDHELKDSWGTQAEHSAPKYRNILSGGLAAYFDYQASSVLPQMPRLPGSFHYSFSYGNIGVFVMDLRSERFSNFNEQIYSPQQLKDLQKFLNDNATKKALFIVSSVPVFFVPGGLADVGGRIESSTFFDHWSHKKNLPARHALLGLLYEHQAHNPDQRVAIVSGDVHIGNATYFQWKEGIKPWLYQFTSSPLTVMESDSTRTKVKIAPWLLTTSSASLDYPCSPGGQFCTGRVGKLPGISGASHNPFLDLNVGIIEVQRSGNVSKLKFKLIGCHPTEESPVTFFESNWLD